MRYLDYNPVGDLLMASARVRPPGPEEVTVEVAYAGVNRADLVQKKGLYPPPAGASPILGLEVSGTVTDVGDSVTGLQVGDRVMGLLAGGGYAEFVTDHEVLFMRVPDSLSLEEAAAIPEAFLTAFQALCRLGQVRHNQTVLIHAGASGVGTAAIQLAHCLGAKVIVTAGTDAKCSFCKSLGAGEALNYRTEDFEPVVRSLGGVDVVIDVVGGGYLPKNINVLNTDGRYVLLAFMGGPKAEINLGRVLVKRIHLMGTTLRGRSLDYKQALINDFISQFLSRFETGELKPVIDRVFTTDQANEAHNYMGANRNMGKLLLRWA